MSKRIGSSLSRPPALARFLSSSSSRRMGRCPFRGRRLEDDATFAFGPDDVRRNITAPSTILPLRVGFWSLRPKAPFPSSVVRRRHRSPDGDTSTARIRTGWVPTPPVLPIPACPEGRARFDRTAWPFPRVPTVGAWPAERRPKAPSAELQQRRSIPVGSDEPPLQRTTPVVPTVRAGSLLPYRDRGYRARLPPNIVRRLCPTSVELDDHDHGRKAVRPRSRTTPDWTPYDCGLAWLPRPGFLHFVRWPANVVRRLRPPASELDGLFRGPATRSAHIRATPE